MPESGGAPQKSVLVTMALTDRATVTAGCSTPPSMPPSNVLNYQPGATCRLLSLAASELVFDLRAALAASAFHGLTTYRYVIVIGCKITSAGTIEAWTGSSAVAVASTGTAALHVGPQSFWLSVDSDAARFPVRHTVVDLGSQRTEGFLRLKLSDPTNPLGFLDVGIVIPHPGYAFNAVQKPRFGSNEELRATMAVSGATHLQNRPRMRTRELTLQTLGPQATAHQTALGGDQRAEVLTQWLGHIESTGVSDTFAVVTDLSPSSLYMNEIVYGRATGVQPIVLPEAWGGTQWVLSYEEMK